MAATQIVRDMAEPDRLHRDVRQPLPGLAEPTPAQLVVSGVWIAMALLLLAAAGARIGQRVSLVQWWLPVSLWAGIMAADFASGLLHWGADTWGRADLPIVGARFLVPFRVHHLNPDDFLRRRFLDTNGDVAALTIPALAGLLVFPLDLAWQQAAAVAGLAFCALAGMTNQIHQWAHMPVPPKMVRGFQALGLLLRPRHHRTHHDRPYDAHYCITTGWCNRPLEAIGFFRRLERAVTRVTGARPREDEQDRALEAWLRGRARSPNV